MYLLNKSLGNVGSIYADCNKQFIQFNGVLNSWEIDPTKICLALSRFSTIEILFKIVLS